MSVYDKTKVFALLDEMRIAYERVDHPAVFTIEEMEALGLERMDQVVKNLFIRDDKKRAYYLIMLENSKSANLKELRQKIGSKPLTFASEEDLYHYLRLQKGAVTPLGALHDVDHKVVIVIDNALKQYERVGIHPNDNTATVFLPVDDLVQLLGARGQEILFLDL